MIINREKIDSVVVTCMLVVTGAIIVWRVIGWVI